MSLKAFHILFIVLSILLSFGFGAWCLREHAKQANGALQVLGAGSLVVGVGLVGYGIWFLKKLKNPRLKDDE